VFVFIDESGDPGFKVAKGSSQLFVVGMVIFQEREAAQKAQACIDKVAKELGHKPEFKFSSCRSGVRDGFFSQVCKQDFNVRALVVDKTVIWSENLRTRTDRFYNYFIQLMLKHHGGALHRAHIIIDGSGSREFQMNLKTYLRQQVPFGTIAEVRMRNSKSDRLLQLADMCVGAIYRAHRKDERQDARWLTLLGPRIGNIWNFE
jgi:hypothetical protein